MSPLAALYLDWALTGLWPITGKWATAYVDPLLFGEAALLLGLLALAPLLARGGRWKPLFAPELRLPLFVMGALGSGITTFLLLTAVTHTTPANAAIVCQVEVVYSAILSAAILRERIGPKQGAATAMVLSGTALILWNDLGTPHWKGDVILLFTPWLFQISHIFSKRLPPGLDHVTIAGARMFYGALTLAPFALWTAFSPEARFVWTPASGALLAFHAVVLNAVNITLWYMAIRHLELAKTTAIMLSYPALTLLYSWLLGRDAVHGHQVAGLLFSMSGAIWLTLQVRERAPASAPAGPALAPAA